MKTTSKQIRYVWWWFTMGLQVGLQAFSRGEYFATNKTMLRLIIMNSLNMKFQSMSWPEFFTAFWAKIWLIHVILFYMICQICLILSTIFTHCALPLHSHHTLHPHWHALDQSLEICEEESALLNLSTYIDVKNSEVCRM